jgi:lipopolysaccharide export system permease protein
MRLIERYLFRQLLGPTLLATAALTAVAVLSQALSSISILVQDRQSPLVFAKIILLAMPQLIVLILPVAVLVAACISVNRLHTENEIVVCYAAGVSRWRVAAPAMRLAVLVGLVSLVITQWVQPLSYRALRDTLQAVRTDLATSMIKPGGFTHPAPGLTVYAQSVDDEGRFHNLFIDHETPGGRDATITAREGRLTSRAGAPMLQLWRGTNAEVSPAGVLNLLSWDEYLLDLRPLIGEERAVRYKLSDRYPHELFFPDTRQAWDAANAGPMQAEGHARLAAPLYNIAFMAMALAAVVGGSFSRLGYAPRIALVAAAALVTRAMGFAVQGAAGQAPMLNVVQYLTPLAAVAASALILFRPERRRRRRAAVPAIAGARPLGLAA